MSDYRQVAMTVGDGFSISVLLGTIAQYLPAVAALFTIIWTLIRVYETATVQRWIRRWKDKRNG